MIVFSLQISMNAPLGRTTVMLMQLASIRKETLPALVTVAGVEMESVVLVTLSSIYSFLEMKFP